MGIFTKIKDILFEEEEVVETVPEKKAPIKEEKRSEPPKEDVPISRQIQPEKKAVVKEQVEPASHQETRKSSTESFESERALFRNDNTFPFPEFDEEEFNSTLKAVQKPKASTNVLEYERKKRIEKRTESGRTEVRETVEKKRFKPSPIISPVYGILNEDYRPEDIQSKNDFRSDLDIESVRKKAFEPDEETYYEETVTVKVKEPIEEREQKVKTIDELLEDTSDVTIDIEDAEESPKVEDINEYDDIDSELDELINESGTSDEEEENQTEFEDDDTLENDLFDLIDSMYDNREEE